MAADSIRDSAGDDVPPERDYQQFLVEQAQKGEEIVWKQWFDEYYPQLYRYAFLRLRRKAEAEDIVAQVFLEAVKGIDRYRYQGRPILAWLFRIAHNLISDDTRAKQRAQDFEAQDFDDGTQRQTREEGPESSIENLDLLEALNTLTADQRDAVLLRFFMSMSTREAAEVMGKTEAAVYSLQARALITLRETLGDRSPL